MEGSVNQSGTRRNRPHMELGRQNSAASSVSPAGRHRHKRRLPRPLNERPQAGTHKGAGERWRKSLNGYPLTTGCGDRILYLDAPNCRWRFESFKPQSRRRPLSSTPASPRRPHRARTASQSCALQICIWHHREDVKSSTGSEPTAPRRGYFFFLAATLRLAGAFFFAAVFAFVAFFTILPS